MGTGIRTLFTVEEANQVLPLVRSIVRDVVNDFRELRNAGRERRALEVESAGSRSAARHIESLKDKVNEFSARIEGYLRELSDLGLEASPLVSYSKYELPPARSGSVTYVESVDELVEKLHTEAKVL